MIMNIFLILDKLQVRRNNSVSTIGQVRLLISLRRPLHFSYSIEFVDMDETILDTMEGTKGATNFSLPLNIAKDTEVMARFKIRDIRGPNSDPVYVDVQNPGMLIVSHRDLV